MGLPKITIEFKGKAASALQRGERGIVAVLLKGTDEGVTEIKSVLDLPATLTGANATFVKDAFMGNENAPLKVLAVTYKGEDIKAGLDLLETLNFQYGAIPELADTDKDKVKAWVKEVRDQKDKTVKMVLAGVKGDHEGIINFTTDKIVLRDGRKPSTNEFTPRIAGLLAGTPLTRSATYSVLEDVESVERISIADGDARIDNGELILINENNKIKLGRAVTSLTTVGNNKNALWQKILVVEKMDMWKDDIKSTIADNYVGRFPNTYDNKCLLISDIRLYNKQLELEGILDNSSPAYNNVNIDIAAQASFLETIGELEDGMSDDDVKKAATRDKVFIMSNLKFTDAMEDFTITANI